MIVKAGRDSLSDLVFTPDSALLAGMSSTHDRGLLAGRRTHLRLWEVSTGRERLALPVPEQFGCLSAGKDLVCIGGGEVMVLDRESKLERAFGRHLYPEDSPSLIYILSAALSPDGRALALVTVRETGLPNKKSILVLLSIPPPARKHLAE